jgi:16S rRNA (adenine1518-N6/adenine1519-N6)-dimethyltransferase
MDDLQQKNAQIEEQRKRAKEEADRKAHEDKVAAAKEEADRLLREAEEKAEEIKLPELKEEIISYAKVGKGDIRTFDLRQLPAGYKIVANIPYYLTSNLVRLLGESSNKPERAVLLVQKEVAERICAKPGQMSMLSVVAQWYFECSLGVVVPAKSFTPPPKVDSQVVIMKTKIAASNVDEKSFFRLVKAGFSERRKTLLNSLSGGLGLGKNQVEIILKQAKIEPSQRAQTLSIEDWLNLYRAFSS